MMDESNTICYLAILQLSLFAKVGKSSAVKNE